MAGESMLQFESSNIQNILIALVVICAIVYGYIEFRKINMKLQELESKLSRINDIDHHIIHDENESGMGGPKITTDIYVSEDHDSDIEISNNIDIDPIMMNKVIKNFEQLK